MLLSVHSYLTVIYINAVTQTQNQKKSQATNGLKVITVTFDLHRAGFSWCEAWGPARSVKSGGTKLEAPKAPRIEMPKASRGMRNGS